MDSVIYTRKAVVLLQLFESHQMIRVVYVCRLCQWIGLPQIQIVGVSTTDQKADLFTKSLRQPEFERLQNLLLGW